jgi:hypothetical protein
MTWSTNGLLLGWASGVPNAWPKQQQSTSKQTKKKKKRKEMRRRKKGNEKRRTEIEHQRVSAVPAQDKKEIKDFRQNVRSKGGRD